jgi:hypothetical protein
MEVGSQFGIALKVIFGPYWYTRLATPFHIDHDQLFQDGKAIRTVLGQKVIDGRGSAALPRFLEALDEGIDQLQVLGRGSFEYGPWGVMARAGGQGQAIEQALRLIVRSQHKLNVLA